MATVLFFDDWWLLKRLNMNRQLGKPTWVPEAVLEDDITDGTWNFPFVFKDSNSGKWIGLYCGTYYEQPNGIRRSSGLCIAESEDGIHWQKPDVSKRIPIPDRNRPNQVLSMGKIDGGPVFLDVEESDPARRLKFLFSGFLDRRKEGGDMNTRDLLMATSADGYAWHVEKLNWQDRPLDAPISTFYNHYAQKYMINSRPILGDRRVCLTPTADFKTFEDPMIIMHPDPEDPPLIQFYGMPIYRYENMYLGLLWRIHIDPFTLSISQGEVDCCLTYSYNGLIFNRAYHRAFVPLNDRGMFGGGCIYVSCLAVDDEHRLRLYSGASKTGHFQTKTVNDAALALHTLRLDGFVYLESYATTGHIATRPVQFHGPGFSLNVRVPYGSVRVQLSDAKGTPYSGFSFDDSVAYTGDDLFHVPKWKSNPSIGSLGNNPIHIEIEITRGEIYSIRGDFSLRTANPAVISKKVSLGPEGYMTLSV